MVDRLAIARRLQADGRWGEVEPVKNRMIKEARQQGMDKESAQAWAYAEIDRLYPPLPEPEPAESASESPAESTRGRVQGLGDIPPDWPDLPDNASLAAEIGWVQAQRLRVVSEGHSGQPIVRLDQARTPAPSWAALGWLETSIRSYAKYVDIVARSLKDEQDEQQAVRRERMAIEEIRGLLDEMHRD